MTDSVSGKIKAKRQRSPGFPYLGISKCLELCSSLHKAANSGYVRIADIAQYWDVTPFSGSHLRYVSALSEFEFIESSGSGKDRRIKLTKDAVRILEDEREGVREGLLADAALKPKMVHIVFKGSDEKNFHGWGFERPADSIALSTLKFDLKFTSQGARKFLEVYDECLRYLDKDIEDRKEIEIADALKESDDVVAEVARNFFGASRSPKNVQSSQNPASQKAGGLKERGSWAPPIVFDMRTVKIQGEFSTASELKEFIDDLAKLIPLMDN